MSAERHQHWAHGKARPIARFLGEEHAGGGPFALLGLTPEACSEDLVLTSLDRQIEKVASHPECDTPEADEVRLALHAAAAQLLDPIVRRHLISRWTGKSHAANPAAARPAAGAGVGAGLSAPAPAAVHAPVARSAAERRLEHDAVLTLGLYGGWNARALRRLVSLAHARGLGNEQVVATLRNLSNRRRSGAATHRHPAAATRSGPSNGVATHTHESAQARPRQQPLGPSRVSSHPTPHPAVSAVPASMPKAAPQPSREPSAEEQDPARRVLKQAMLFGGIGIVSLAVALAAIYLATRNATTGGVAPTPPAPPAPVANGSPSPSPTETPAPRPAEAAPKPKPRVEIAPGDPLLAIQELNSVADAAAVSPEEAAARLKEIVPKLSTSWTKLPRDRQVEVTDSILEFLYRVSGSPAQVLDSLRAISAGAEALARSTMSADEVLPAAWSCGVLVRLNRERDLPAAAKTLIEQELASALGAARPAVEHTFEAGVQAAMYIIPKRLTPSPAAGARPDAAVDADAWAAFAQAGAAMPADDAAKSRVLLNGLETLLSDGPEPNASQSVKTAVTELVSKMSWRQGDESRRALLRWFADSRFTNADLQAVTNALATKSSAEGVDINMVLSTAAAEGVRADLRERYATVWGLQDTIGRDQLLGDWVKAAREAISQSHMAVDDTAELASAALLSRLNEAAYWHWRGDSTESSLILSRLDEPVAEALRDTRGQPPESIAVDLSDGSWGERYLGARTNIKVRRELLSELEQRAGLGAVDAEVLVTEALLGSPQDVRQRAQEIVRKFASLASVINAMLERLPKAPKVTGTASLIEAVAMTPLPSVKDPQWEMRARRALVERLLEAVAAESPNAKIERLGRVLRVSYRSMASQSTLSDADRAAPQQPPAAQSAQQVWRAWRAAADRLVPSVAAPIPLQEIDRRHPARQTQAVGMIQEFAAEQASMMEALSYLVVAERPASIEEVRLVLSDAAAERRRAKHIFRQMNAAERAMVQLWLLRFGEQLSENTEGGS